MSSAEEARLRQEEHRRRMAEIVEGVSASFSAAFNDLDLGGLHSGGVVWRTEPDPRPRPSHHAPPPINAHVDQPGQASTCLFLSPAYLMHSENIGVACARAQLLAARGPAMRQRAERKLLARLSALLNT